MSIRVKTGIRSERNKNALQNGKNLVGYLLAGYPDEAGLAAALTMLEATSLDILEMGYPSVNPYADGAVIQAAHGRVDMARAQSAAYWRTIRALTEKPIWLMAYKADFIDTGMYRVFADEELVDALVIPDMAFEERVRIAEELDNSGVDVLGFANPDMEEEELHACYAQFPLVYSQLHTGRTGQPGREDAYFRQLALAKRYEGVYSFAGFGVDGPDKARALFEKGFEGVVVGTAMMKSLDESPESLLSLVQGLIDARGK